MPEIVENNSLQNFDFQSNKDGSWNLIINESVTPGPHSFIVEDEYGNTDEAIFYLLKEEKPTFSKDYGFIESLTVKTTALNYISLILFLALIISLFNIWRLAKTADTGASASPHKTKHLYHAYIFIASVLLFSFLGINFYPKIKTGVMEKQTVYKPAVISKISGQLIDPLTLQGVKADLTNGSTVVHTSLSGYFVFSNIDLNQGIKINNPDLMKTINYTPKKSLIKENFPLYFNAQMYNELSKLTDFEARGKITDAYKLLPNLAKNKINKNDFIKNYTTILTPENINDQEITIEEIEIKNNWLSDKYDLTFSQVVAIRIQSNDKTDNYYLVFEQGLWKILK